MKKRLYFIFTFVLFGLYAETFAQETKHVLGLKAGPSYNFLYGFKELNEVSKPAYLYSVGLSYQFNLNRTFSLQTGLSHDFKGEMQYVDFTNLGYKEFINFTYSRRISYLIAPVVFRAYFGEKLKLFLNAGAYAGLALSHTVRTEIDGQDYGSSIFTEDTRPIDLGLISGAGLEFPVSSKFDLSLELRNNLGLTDLRKKENTTKDHFRLNSLSLLAGLSYKFSSSANAN